MPRPTINSAPTRPVVVVGPSSWNHVIQVGSLPSPTPHMDFATDHWWTMGGTSAGKALHLADLGVPHSLVSSVGDDDWGRQVRLSLKDGGVTSSLLIHDGPTESHVNLMSDGGERVSIYTDSSPSPSPAALEHARREISGASAIVLDLSLLGQAVINDAKSARAEVWVDLHDWNGEDAFQRPFLEVADVVVASHERLNDAEEFLRRCVRGGASLAIVTQGADGALALNSTGNLIDVPALKTDVTDSNGAGDAFVAGALAARLAGRSLPDVLRLATEQASRALMSRHLCTSLDEKST